MEIKYSVTLSKQNVEEIIKNYLLSTMGLKIKSIDFKVVSRITGYGQGENIVYEFISASCDAETPSSNT